MAITITSPAPIARLRLRRSVKILVAVIATVAILQHFSPPTTIIEVFPSGIVVSGPLHADGSHPHALAYWVAGRRERISVAALASHSTMAADQAFAVSQRCASREESVTHRQVLVLSKHGWRRWHAFDEAGVVAHVPFTELGRDALAVPRADGHVLYRISGDGKIERLSPLVGWEEVLRVSLEPIHDWALSRDDGLLGLLDRSGGLTIVAVDSMNVLRRVSGSIRRAGGAIYPGPAQWPFIIATNDGAVQLCDAEGGVDGRTASSIDNAGGIASLCYVDGFGILYASGNGRIHAWSERDRREVWYSGRLGATTVWSWAGCSGLAVANTPTGLVVILTPTQ